MTPHNSQKQTGYFEEVNEKRIGEYIEEKVDQIVEVPIELVEVHQVPTEVFEMHEIPIELLSAYDIPV